MILHDYVQQLLAVGVTRAFQAGKLGNLTQLPIAQEILVENPKNPDHGHYATPLALTLAKAAKLAPRTLADALVHSVQNMDVILSVAGPGFINIRLADPLLAAGLQEILTQQANYGRTVASKPEKILVEFVSANPTGPLHVGHGRWAALGSAITNLLTFAGHEVHTEFYINDAGNQMNLLGISLQARYRQALGEPATMPENGYQGKAMIEMAQGLISEVGANQCEAEAIWFQEYAYHKILAQQKAILTEFHAEFETWFSERILHQGQPSAIEQGLQALDAAGYLDYRTEETDSPNAAIFFKTTQFGDDKDRVVKKTNGDYTYMAADIAYHRHKLQRGYDRLINILGADHHGYMARLKAIVQAFGYPADTLEVMIGQMVKLYRQNPTTGQKEEVRMSKRTGEGVTVDDLLYGLESEETAIGTDAARWYLLSQSPDSQITFDLDLAVEQSKDNPVFYAQYAYARSCSLERVAAEKGFSAPDTFVFVDNGGQLLLQQPEEQALILALLKAPELYRLAAIERAPHKLITYTAEVAQLFHRFYDKCPVLRIMENDPALAYARWGLCRATRQVLANSLDLLGISHPTAM